LSAEISAVIIADIHILKLQGSKMENPIALKLNNSDIPDVYRVSIDPILVEQLRNSRTCPVPAIVMARKATILSAMSAGIIDSADIVVIEKGNWADAILIVLPEQHRAASGGDDKFLLHVKHSAPNLAELATQTVAAIRAAGVDGELLEGSGGRWVNRPLNTFTLKAQPRAENLQFTLYGNPETYNGNGFLRKDQNSYSRGWVREVGDIEVLADLARQSHARRKR
jgi:hypothetical protein